MVLVLQILVTIIVIEAMTNILSKSELFRPLRKFLFESKNKSLRFIHDILDCPYCTSVWVSVFCVIMLYLYINEILPQMLALFFIGILFHRLANILHFVIDRLDSNHIDLDKDDIT